MFVFSFNFLWKNVLRVVPAHLPPALEPGSGLQQNLEPTGLSPAGPRMLQPPPGHSSRSLLRGGTGAEPGGCRGCPRVSPPLCPIPPVHAGAVLSHQDMFLFLSSFVVPRLGQGKQQIVGCRRCWGRVSPSPDLPRRRRAGRPGKVLAGGGSGSRPPTRLQELAPTRCPVTPGGHRQLLGPRWPQAGQDGALSPLAPYLEAAAGAHGQGGGCGGSGRARAGAGRKEPRGQPLPPAHGAGAKQPRAKANSSPDNCHY